jgi:hypothetical protein
MNEESLQLQPIMWNSIFTTTNGQMLGAQPKLTWGQLATGPKQLYA